MCIADCPVITAPAIVNDQRVAAADPVESLAVLLDQLSEVLLGLTDTQYVTKPVGVIASSVGGHVRHCLDHVRALLGAVHDGDLDYDRRVRGTPVESDRACALEAIAELSEELRRMSSHVLSMPVGVRSMVSCDGGAVELQSTIGREIVFVFSHTIHHNALIGAMVQMLGATVPERFGYAPSTIAAAGRNCVQVQSCAR